MHSLSPCLNFSPLFEFSLEGMKVQLSVISLKVERKNKVKNKKEKERTHAPSEREREREREMISMHQTVNEKVKKQNTSHLQLVSC